MKQGEKRGGSISGLLTQRLVEYDAMMGIDSSNAYRGTNLGFLQITCPGKPKGKYAYIPILTSEEQSGDIHILPTHYGQKVLTRKCFIAFLALMSLEVSNHSLLSGELKQHFFGDNSPLSDEEMGTLYSLMD